MMPPPFDYAGWNGTLSGYWYQIEKPRPNLWIGTTAENQEQAEARIPHLLRVQDGVIANWPKRPDFSGWFPGLSDH
jgi:hypothetical protein